LQAVRNRAGFGLDKNIAANIQEENLIYSHVSHLVLLGWLQMLVVPPSMACLALLVNIYILTYSMEQIPS
jgi:hypothetical protein